MKKQKYYGLQVHTLTFLKVDENGDSIDGKEYEYTGDHSGFCDGIDDEYLKEVDIDNEIEKRWDDFYEWLHTCPFKWSQSSHPTSGMTAINFDIEEE
tara:strand:- start:476 stop:766 length:291 start_codon:yes stop_codon:yes gene_type:complete